MKRLIFSCLFLVTAVSWTFASEPADFRVVCKDGSVAYFSGQNTEMSFNNEATILYLTTEEYCVSYAVDGVEAIEFAESGTYEDRYSYEGRHIDVAIDPTDDTAYTEVTEEIIDDEEHADYGDFIENYSPRDVVVINYDGDKVTSSKAPSGVNMIANNSHVVVTSAVKDVAYILKGTTTNGSFKLFSDKKTQITLDGVSITNPTGAAINIQTGKTILVKLSDNATNYLEDGKEYVLEGTEQQKGTFFSEGQLIFSGKGSLNVKSNFGHGIASDDYLRVRDGNITINSVRNGISAKDRFVMYGGNLTINALQDGVDVREGYVEIGGGELDIQAIDEGIIASYEGEDDGTVDATITPFVTIKGGLIKVITTGDKGHGLRAMSSLDMSGGIVQVTTKGAGSKAMMSESDMALVGGKVTAFTEGDALYELNDLSSSAGIRSKGALKINNMTIGIKSVGAGGKGINNVGDISVKNSNVTVLAIGENCQQNSLISYSRGAASDGGVSLDGGVLMVRSHDASLYVKGIQNFLNDAVYNGYQIGSRK